MATANELDAIDFARADGEGMYAHVVGFVRGFAEAWTAAAAFPLPAHYIKVNKIVLSGMGGSAQGGAIARDLVYADSKVPIEIVRDYHLPAWVDSNTLVIAVSYSGTTEETVSTFIEGYEKGAKLMGMGTGGQIASLARKYKVPYFENTYNSQPRAALHVHLATILNFLVRLGHGSITNEDVASLEAIEKYSAAKWVESIPEASNEAKQLARKIFGRVPVIVGDGSLSAIASRYKAQFNENSKNPAYFETLPEMNHNALVGTEMPKLSKEALYYIFLDSDNTDPQNKTRMMLTEQLYRDRRYEGTRKRFEANNPLAEAISAIHFGDFVSYYLAILNQVDPTAVNVIAEFKGKLAG